VTNEAQAAGAELARAFLPAEYIGAGAHADTGLPEAGGSGGAGGACGAEPAWRDRFGPLPEPVKNLLLMTEIKLAASKKKITMLEVREKKVMMTRGGELDPHRGAVSTL